MNFQLSTQPVIRWMGFDDLPEVARIHTAAFPGFFLARMGHRFLNVYYKAVLEFPASVALVAENEATKELMGFAVGFTDPKGFYAFFSARSRRLRPVIVLAALRSPTLIAQILRNRRRVAAQAESFSNCAAELSSIAVDAGERGIGSALLQAFLIAVKSKGVPTVTLTTDAENNDQTRRFYESRGFVIDGHELRSGRLLCRYIITL